MQGSVGKRLVKNFILVIFISVAILEALLIYFVRLHYYNNIEALLTNQIKTSSDFYSRYFANSSLEENVQDNVDVFWKQTEAQVQIIDPEGNILVDSIGVVSDSKLESSDYKKALKGEKGTWYGRVPYDSWHVMAVSYPLKSGGKIVGVLRFLTSLRSVDSEIVKIGAVFLFIGVLVVFITGAVSLVLADSIVNPVKEVTAAASKMASGNFRVRSRKISDDEIGKLSDTLNYMADEILKKEQLKNEFIASISHELRTPLTAIRGWALTLEDSGPEEKELIKDGLKIIVKESERLSSMVEELLDFSKFVNGKISLNKGEVNPADIAVYIRKYMEPRSIRENITFSVECEENMPSLNLDSNRIKQALINILDNAFKFSHPGGMISLKIGMENGFAVFTAIDNGCGISKEDLPRVKEKFFKGKNSRSQNGIGLSISDEIVKMHDGFLEISSEPGKGTAVCIKLPSSPSADLQ